ncbi:MAG TPA: LytTR family transcriptional regulator DNA-binding domain-containing protein [Rhodanobacteraceae bacterium]|nr:LytTR family transcriptional regulator DNA-binding domain-containing protein [Rhodanobacteraceae bacterium]
MRLRTLIVDDEPLARRGLSLRLARHSDVEIVAEAGNGREAFFAISEHQPDLMFLDVQMPGVDGFELLKAVPAAQMPVTVFVTAYDQYALKAFEANALDYLLKPVEDARLDIALDRVRQEIASRDADLHRSRLLRLLGTMSGRPDLTLDEALADAEQSGRPTDDRLAIKDAGRILRVPLDEILWIDAAGDYMCVHTGADTHVLRATMRELEGRLDPRRFQRIHRSTIVNVARVRELRSHLNGEYFLILDSGQQLKLSRSYKDKVRLLH